MKNITKITVGAGLLAGLLAGIAAPANAATEAPAIEAAGDRLEGPLVLKHAGLNLWSGAVEVLTPVVGMGPNNGGTLAAATDAAKASGGTWSVPAPGNTGPVKHEDSGLCVLPAPGIGVAANVAFGDCADAADITVTSTGGALMTSAGGTAWTMMINGVDNPATDILMWRTRGSVVTATGFLETSVMSPVADDVTPVSIDGVTGGVRPSFAGKGEPGAEVVLTLPDGTEVATVTVDEDGNWMVPSDITFAEGATFTVTATQTVGDDVTTDSITFTCVPTPIVDPLVAGGAAVLAAAAAGAVVFAKRRKNAAAQAA